MFIVLLSGGLDSAVSAFVAARDLGPGGLALIFDYGQKAVKREVAAARHLAKFLGLNAEVIALPFLKQVTQTALVMNDKVIPQVKMAKLDDRSESEKSAQAVWVPNRNGLFLNIAACYAEGLGFGKIVVGFNAEEAMTFPDNSANFVSRAESFFQLSTLRGVEIVAPTLGLNKTEIVRLGKQLAVPFERVWSCYHGSKKMCGRCESCMRSRRAYHGADLGEAMAPYFAS